MQRLSLGSPAGRPHPSAVADGPDEKAAKSAVRGAAAVPDKSIHLVPVLTLLCFLVLFLLSHEPSATAALTTDSPVLAVTARSLEATPAAAGGVAAGASVGSRGGVHRRLKEDPDRGRRMRASLRR